MVQQKPLDAEQVSSVRDSLLSITHAVKNCTDHFEEATKFDSQEIEVLFLLYQTGASLAVKEIARQVHNMSLSTLTRVLDRLEERGYIMRNLNRNDRRSFNVSLCPKGEAIGTNLVKTVETIAVAMLEALTPAERLILVELYAKIRANVLSTYADVSRSVVPTPVPDAHLAVSDLQQTEVAFQ